MVSFCGSGFCKLSCLFICSLLAFRRRRNSKKMRTIKIKDIGKIVESKIIAPILRGDPSVLVVGSEAGCVDEDEADEVEVIVVV